MLGTARFAGCQAAKRAASLLPLPGSAAIGSTTLRFEVADTFISVEASVEPVDGSCADEAALIATTVAALTIFDMCKSADRTMRIDDVTLVESTAR